MNFDKNLEIIFQARNGKTASFDAAIIKLTNAKQSIVSQ